MSQIDNPYAPPETPTAVVVDSVVSPGSIRRPVFFTLIAVVVVSGTMSTLTVLFHEFDYKFGGVNALAVATLVLAAISIILAPMFIPAVQPLKALVSTMAVNAAGWLVVIGVFQFSEFLDKNAPTLSPGDIKLIGRIALMCAIASVIVFLFRWRRDVRRLFRSFDA